MTKERYKIVRYYSDDRKKNKVIKKGLTYTQARAHCNRKDTRGNTWFDGFTKE